jgi:hypothetical protein
MGTMVASMDTKEELIRREFPSIQFDSDPDIERYFELRKLGRSQEALDIYNVKLLHKYPDEEKRIRLLKAYRKHDATFAVLLKRSLIELADTIVEKIRKNIAFLASFCKEIDLRNPVKTIQLMEKIIKYLPSEKYAAMDFMETYRRYAETLNYKTEDMEKIATLVKEYIIESISENDALKTPDQLKRELFEKNAQESRKAGHHRLIDLSKIRFSPEDVAKIIINPTVTRKEDKILAYCYKYWLCVNDPIFERTVFIYSRKYHTNHFEIFDCIKRGRTAGSSDEVILNNVSSILASGYSYSIRGDIYLQSTWRRLKAMLFPKMQSVQIAVEEVPKPPIRRLKKAHEKAHAPEPEKKPKLLASSAPTRTIKPETKSIVRKRDTTIAKPVPVPAPIVAQPGKTVDPPPKKQSMQHKNQPTTLPVRASVSQKIKQLSNRSYDVYRDLFLAKVRNVIHAYLQEHQTRPHSLFDTAANEAEDVLYKFFETNYDNPYMDWESGEQREFVEGKGFSVPSLDQIIETCYKNL